MATQTPQQIVVNGIVVSMAAANAADTVPVGQNTLLVVLNNSGGAMTVTANVNAAYKAPNDTAISDTTSVSIPDGSLGLLPLELTEYRDPDTQEVDIDYSTTTGVTRGVVKL